LELSSWQAELGGDLGKDVLEREELKTTVDILHLASFCPKRVVNKKSFKLLVKKIPCISSKIQGLMSAL